MAKGLMFVETAPASAADADRYHDSYDAHIRSLLAIEGVVGATRYGVIGDDGSFVAVYEVEGDDLAAVRQRISDAGRAGQTVAVEGIRLDPPPRVLLLQPLEEGDA